MCRHCPCNSVHSSRKGSWELCPQTISWRGEREEKRRGLEGPRLKGAVVNWMNQSGRKWHQSAARGGMVGRSDVWCRGEERQRQGWWREKGGLKLVVSGWGGIAAGMVEEEGWSYVVRFLDYIEPLSTPMSLQRIFFSSTVFSFFLVSCVSSIFLSLYSCWMAA